MSSLGAWARLFPACLLMFVGVLVLRDWHSEPVLIGVAMCSVALTWMIVTTIHVAHRLVPAADRSRGFEPVITKPAAD